MLIEREKESVLMSSSKSLSESSAKRKGNSSSDTDAASRKSKLLAKDDIKRARERLLIVDKEIAEKLVNSNNNIIVLIYGRYKGTAKYVGNIDTRGLFVGIELDDMFIRNRRLKTRRGFPDNKFYFQPSSSPDNVIFVRPRYIQPFTVEDAAATLIQTQFRMFKARKVIRSSLASRTWNLLDNHNEELGVKRGIALAKTQHNHKSNATFMMMTEPKEEEIADMLENKQPLYAASASSTTSQNKMNVSSSEIVVTLPDTSSYSSSGGSDMDLDKSAEADKAMTAAERVLALAEREVAELSEASLAAIKIGTSYNGPHLRFPLRLDNVLNMMEEFKIGKILHYKYIMALFLLAKRVFDAEETVQDITIPQGARLTVVGDIHGQLEDLYTIFSIKGVPSATNWYLFNGDFVDRGPNGCEVIATMCAFKILYPNHVFLNRGNHEARAQNAWMGFEEEILGKYTKEGIVVSGDRRSALRLHLLCESMFDRLPLAAVIQKKVFVCHGGLFRNDGVTLSQIKSIQRKREPPLAEKGLEDRIYEDILWSDPRPTPQFPRPVNMRRHSERGAGCEFGPGVTNQFCANNQIALVVRSHECVPEGYEILHNGRLITIFSASRYCGTQTNKGAFISFGQDLQPEIHQFFASIDKNSMSFMTEEERRQKLEDDAVYMIIEQICDKRTDLYSYFTSKDLEHGNGPTGKVTRVEFAAALQHVIGLNLPYLHFQPKLAELEIDGTINYSRFLSRYQITNREEDRSWQDAIVQRVCEKLYSLVGADLESAYKKFDIDNSGSIDYFEFVETLKGLDIGLNDQQIYELMRSVDVDDNAKIDFKEFAERFEVAFRNVSEKRSAVPRSSSLFLTRSSSLSSNGVEPLFSRQNSSEALFAVFKEPSTPRNKFVKIKWENLDSWTLECLRTISRKMYKVDRTLPIAFSRFDRGKNGYFMKEDFVTVLKTVYGLQFSDLDAGKLFDAVDANGSEKVNYLEFVEAFQITDSNPNSSSWKQGVIQQVANVLYQNRIQIRHAFRMFDVTGIGKVTAEQFQAGMNIINDMLDHPLNPIQIEELRRCLDKDGSKFYCCYLVNTRAH